MWPELDSDEEELNVSGTPDQLHYRTYAYTEARNRRIRKIICAVGAVALVIVSLIIIIAISSSGPSDSTSVSDNSKNPDAWQKADVKNLRLPSYVEPLSYRIDIEPDFETFVLAGVVEIDVRIKARTSDILLHASDINITSASIQRQSQSLAVQASSITYAGGDAQYAMLEFDALRKILNQYPTDNYTLRLEYRGHLNDEMTGFYRSSYVDSQNNTHWLASTQFEAVGARRAFPCFDEPAFKATFDVALRVDTQRFNTVLSNQPELARADTTSLLDASRTTLQRVTFATTPRMSTYLLAFVVGTFASVRAPPYAIEPADPNAARAPPRVEIHVYSTPDTVNQTVYAASVARRVLAVFEDFFDIEYPLKKLDLIAIPDFSAGAMENWGLITFRTTALLYDARHSSAHDKQRVATVVAHEIAHQWFGNLVTMAWWDELWLNEGFATFCEYYAVEQMYAAETNEIRERGWLMWHAFAADRNAALYLDSLEHSHPIRQPAVTPSDIELLFDTISYSKGGALLRMLFKSSLMQSGNFQRGLHNYLNKHKYQNAHSSDLWAELAAASGEQDLAQFLAGWINKPGYPVLRFEQTAPDSYVVTQQRYLELPPPDFHDTSTWWVPFNLQNDGGQVEVTLRPDQQRSEPFRVSPDYFVANADRWGLYRVAYPPSLHRQLVGHIERNGIGVSADRFDSMLESSARKVTPLDYAGLLNDLVSFSAAGFNNITAADVLTFAERVGASRSPLCWGEALSAIEGFATRLEHAQSTHADALHAVTRRLLAPLVAEIIDGADNVDEDDDIDDSDHQSQLLRESVLPLAVRLGEETVKTKALECWQQATSGSSCVGGVLKSQVGLIAPPLQGAVFVAAALYNDTAFDELFRRYRSSTFPGEKRRLQTALTHVADSASRDRLLAIALDAHSGIRAQDRDSVVVGIARSSTPARKAVWQWLVKNYEQLSHQAGGLFGGASRLVSSVIRLYATQSELDEALQFVEMNRERGLNGRDVQLAIEAAQHNIKWIERNNDNIGQWLSQRQNH